MISGRSLRPQEAPTPPLLGRHPASLTLNLLPRGGAVPWDWLKDGAALTPQVVLLENRLAVDSYHIFFWLVEYNMKSGIYSFLLIFLYSQQVPHGVLTAPPGPVAGWS